MKTHFRHLFLTALAVAAAAGCASAPAKFYKLNATAKGGDAAETRYAVAVGRVTIPAEVDRPQFAVQTAPNRVAIDEFNRWAEPLNENIAGVIAADLAALLGTPRVVSVPLANFDPAYRVTVDVQKFESLPGKAAQIEAVWIVRKTAGNVTLSGRTVVGEPVTDGSFDALAAAHSRALARLSTAIAAAIRADADPKP